MKNDKIFIQDSISDSESKQIIQNKLPQYRENKLNL